MADVDVQMKSLLTQAQVWDAQSTAMGTIESEIQDTQDTESTRIAYSNGSGSDIFSDGYIFGAALNTYQLVAAEIVKAVGQGKGEMLQIGETLVKARQGYETTEQANVTGATEAA